MSAGCVTVVGAGLAGSEAAWQAAERGADVTLVEMRPFESTPAHQSGLFAELVCSNSLRASGLENAVGLLKEEMRRAHSVIMRVADETSVPAGGALAVDRMSFSQLVTEILTSHPRIEVVRRRVDFVPTDGAVTVVATGPLTSGALAEDIARLTGDSGLYFYDAAAPIVTAESIDMSRAFRASRYGKGDADYINCPLTEAEYLRFFEALIAAEKVPARDFEREIFFEGCMPIEVMASRGRDTLLFGPMKPVGLVDPATGERPYAAVQFRQDDRAGRMYNIVGFQTRMRWGEQRRVFSMIPALREAEFVRYGVMHRNTFINSPLCLLPTGQLKKNPAILFAGQMTGVEGYVESAASGLVAGINAARLAAGDEPVVFPRETAHGALLRYITEADPLGFQPMNINFSLLPPLSEKIRPKRLKKLRLSERALSAFDEFLKETA